MKYITLIGDGMADYRIAELGNKTALQAASTPNMDFIAATGRCGVTRTIPDEMPAGSDIAILSILGYDPRKYYTGRGPLEALGRGVELDGKDIAFRCNLVTVSGERLVDYSAGHISSEEARVLIEELNERLPDVEIYAGVGYRHILVLRDAFDGEIPKCTPPHDMLGENFHTHLPENEALKQLILKSREILETHEINKKREKEGKQKANMIWLWGGGVKPELPSFKEKYGVHGSVISAVDLIKGIGRALGLVIVDVPGATGYLDTNYEGKARYALKSLQRNDFVLVHVEAPDEAAHEGDVAAKIRAIEDFDEKVVGNVLAGVPDLGAARILVMPDHYTPVSVRTHTKEPVPFAIAELPSGDEGDSVKSFDEFSARKGAFGNTPVEELMKMLIC